MKILTEGYKYQLENMENPNKGQIIQFIEKREVVSEQNPKGTLYTENDGTTNEEVLKMLINRMYFLQNSFPCKENAIVITNLEESLMWLDKRTADRVKRNVEGKNIK